jgi:hypothetical protein
MLNVTYKPFALSDVMVNVDRLNVVMLSVDRLNVVTLSVMGPPLPLDQTLRIAFSSSKTQMELQLNFENLVIFLKMETRVSNNMKN